MGDGSNVVAADAGFRGLVLRFTAAAVKIDGGVVAADAGAKLQSLVDFTIERGFEGLHTLTGIPGSVGGAIYGNAGAYGNSIDQFIERVDYFDGAAVRSKDNAACEFAYRESVFKRHKNWVILGGALRLPAGDRQALRARADEIRQIRDEKFPPSMLCAGSIFKNLHIRDLPAAAAAEVPRQAVRAGKVASAYFLEKVGAKGMRNGGIAIASYHANLLYNRGGGTAAEVRALVCELKSRIRKRYGFEVEEEVNTSADRREDRTMLRITTTPIGIVLLASALLAPGAAAADWSDLLRNGLDDWTVLGDGIWRLRSDGVLTAYRAPDKKLFAGRETITAEDYKLWNIRQSWLYTKREFEEFDLRLEYWVRSPGNSGISVRDPSQAAWGVSDPPDFRKTPSKLGYEIQINSEWSDKWGSGSIYGLAQAKEGLHRVRRMERHQHRVAPRRHPRLRQRRSRRRAPRRPPAPNQGTHRAATPRSAQRCDVPQYLDIGALTHARVRHCLDTGRRHRPRGHARRRGGAGGRRPKIRRAVPLLAVRLGHGLLLRRRTHDARGRPGAIASARRHPAGRGRPPAGAGQRHAQRLAAAHPPGASISTLASVRRSSTPVSSRR